MRNDPRAPHSLGRRPSVNIVAHQCQATPSLLFMQLILPTILAPQQTLGLDGLDRSLPPGPVYPQSRSLLNQRADAWTAIPPGMFQGSFSAPYRFTPGISDMDGEAHHQDQPIRVEQNGSPGRVNDDPRSRRLDQGSSSSRMGDHDRR